MAHQLPQALQPYRVLDCTRAIGWTCGKLLADLGADVIKVEPPGGDPDRRIGPFYRHVPHPERSLAWFAANTNKRGVTLDVETSDGQALWRTLTRTADFVLESFPPGYMERQGLGFQELSQLNPRLIWTAITPFGQSGPYADYRATDLGGMAMGGLMSLCGESDRPPVRMRPAQAYVHAGLQAAVGTLLAHHYRVRTGEGQFVDVSMQHALSWTNIPARQYWELNRLITERNGASRAFGDQVRRIIFPCRDGYVALMGVMNAREWGPMVAWLAGEGMAEDLTDESWRILAEHAGPGALTQAALTDEELAHIDGVLSRFFAKHTKTELSEEARRRHILLFSVATPRDLLEDPQLGARDFFAMLLHPELGQTLRYPGAPYRLSKTPWQLRRRAPLIGEHNEAIYSGELGLSRVVGVDGRWSDLNMSAQALAGLRVIDFTWVGVGPLLTRYLADYGAEVIRIESRTHPDSFRSAPPFVEERPGVERSGYFLNLNTSKYHVTLNLDHARGRALARKLIATADVVAENFSAQVMGKWGLTYDDLRQVNPALVMISLSMAGRTGPHRDTRGFGTVLQAAAGFAHLTGWPDRPPSIPGVAYTDWTTPLFGLVALLAALDYRQRTGQGQYIDVSNLEAGVNCLETAILDYTANGRTQTRAGNEWMVGDLPGAAPHGVYRCQGVNRWCAIAVLNDQDWRRFCAVLGHPAWTREARFTTVLSRVKHRDELHALIEGWTCQFTAEEVMQRLQDAGIAAGMVQNAADLAHDPQLDHRGQAVSLDHPEVGVQRYDAHAVQLRASPAQLGPVPVMGQHNAYVFKELLGLSEMEYDVCMREGVFE